MSDVEEIPVSHQTTITSDVSKAAIAVVDSPLCPLCSTEGEQIYSGLVDWLFGVPGTWGMRRCDICKVAWLDPQPVAGDISKLYARYYTHVSPRPTQLGHLRKATEQAVWARLGYPVAAPQSILPRILSRIRSIARSAALEVLALPGSVKGTLLDVGCGNGDFIARMAGFGWKVRGVEPDSSARSHARSRGLEVFSGMISDVPIDELYDVVTLNHVVEHVADPVDLLRECGKRLRPETGRLFVSTPNLDSLGHWWFKDFWRGLEVPRHLILFSPLAFRQCVQKAGLQIQSLGTETRMARMLYVPSVSAKQGCRDIGRVSHFKPSIRIAAYLFQALEDSLIPLNRWIGEEIFCVCRA